ncbi:MAG: PEP-CTERM sorting domain-containing protein, partial [Planctomycetia bacterium]|nr:PEP-CTERM sorting domain-containing protein [Planctomycetia bacterium]
AQAYRIAYTENGATEYKYLMANKKGEGALSITTDVTGNGFSTAQLQKLDGISLNSLEQVALYSVDIQGSGGIAATDGTTDHIFGLGNKWNVYHPEIPDWLDSGYTPARVTASLQLFDSEGFASTVEFAINSSDEIVAYQPNSYSDFLLGDYLLGNQERFGSTPIGWQISGLSDDYLYQLIMFSGPGYPGTFTVNNAEGEDTITAANNSYASFFVYAENGIISGSFGELIYGNENDWSAFHLLAYANPAATETPEPSTWILLLSALGFGAICKYRRRKGELCRA